MTIALELLGAVAGISALSTAVGGVILWLRLNALHLPGDESVSVLPTGLLLTVGIHALALPVCLGLLAGLAFAFARPTGATDRTRFAIASGLAFGPAIAALLAGTWQMQWVPGRVAAYGAVALALVVIVFATRDGASPQRLAWTAAIAVLACGSVVVIARTQDHPRFAPIAVISAGANDTTTGFYVGESADRLYVVPQPTDGRTDYVFADSSPGDRMLVLPRAKITKMAISQPVDIRQGRDHASALLADLQGEARSRPAPEVVTTLSPSHSFAPIVNLHAREDLWPMDAGDFLANASLRWSAGGSCPPVPVERRVDPGRLTSYRYTPVASSCGRGATAAFAANQLTRPFDRRTRPEGLAPDQGFYLDLQDRLRTGTEQLGQEGTQTVLNDAPVYFERRDETRGLKAIRITYWFLFGMSRPPAASEAAREFVHEGDWGRFSVLLIPRADDTYRPDSVRYYAATRPRRSVGRGQHDRRAWRGGDASRRPSRPRDTFVLRARRPVLARAQGARRLDRDARGRGRRLPALPAVAHLAGSDQRPKRGVVRVRGRLGQGGPHLGDDRAARPVALRPGVVDRGRGLSRRAGAAGGASRSARRRPGGSRASRRWRACGGRRRRSSRTPRAPGSRGRASGRRCRRGCS